MCFANRLPSMHPCSFIEPDMVYRQPQARAILE